MSDQGTQVDSWRVWFMPDLRVPELFTVQVHHGRLGGVRGTDWWEVRVWCHWAPHWWDDPRTFKSLGSARKDARRTVEVLGGRCYQGVHTISTDAPGLDDRWVVLPVEPPPPWCERWPGPQPWREQLGSTPGPWTFTNL